MDGGAPVRLETLDEAAARTGVAAETLRRRARRLGMPSLPRDDRRWGRTSSDWDRAAVHPKANRSGAPWLTAHEDVIRRSFGRKPRAYLMARIPNRTWVAICEHARRLRVASVPKGWMILLTASEHFGYAPSTFAALLARHNVEAVPLKSTYRKSSKTRPWKMVRTTDARRAVLADLRMETIPQGAARLGVPCRSLRRWLMVDQRRTEPYAQDARFEPGLLGRLAAQHRAVTTETLVEAAARTKVYINTLRRWCRKGRLLPAIHKGHVHRLDPAKVDAVVNARRPQRVEGT